MVVCTGNQQRLYYLKASFSSGSDVTMVELYRDINIATETFFMGETTETVGSENDVYASYTVGWAYSMTSNTRTINGNGYFGYILASHKSNSCLTDGTSDFSIPV